MLASAAVLPEQQFAGAADVTGAFRARGCKTLRDAAMLVRNLPYGRNEPGATSVTLLLERPGCNRTGSPWAETLTAEKIPVSAQEASIGRTTVSFSSSGAACW